MIISMKPDATQDQIDHVCERIREFGYKVHSIQGEERVVIGVIGVGDVSECLEAIEVAPGVASAVRISSPIQIRQQGIQAGAHRRSPSTASPLAATNSW